MPKQTSSDYDVMIDALDSFTKAVKPSAIASLLYPDPRLRTLREATVEEVDGLINDIGGIVDALEDAAECYGDDEPEAAIVPSRRAAAKPKAAAKPAAAKPAARASGRKPARQQVAPPASK
jgi:hypothetical protein